MRYGADLSFKAVVNNPAPCTTGFINEGRNVNDLSAKEPAYTAYCKEPANSPIGVRGGRNNECPNDPARRSVDAYGCGLSFQSNEEFLRSRDDATHTMLEAAKDSPKNVPQPEGAPPFQPAGLPALPMGLPTR